MSNSTHLMTLHFRYRVWIAEMNFHINIFRICEDYLTDISTTKKEPEALAGIEEFQNQFVNLRKEIDELRHEMHLAKMTLAADSKQSTRSKSKKTANKSHADLRRRYLAYRKKFDSVKKQFGQFESKWLP